MKRTIFRKLLLGFATIVVLAVGLSVFLLIKFAETLRMVDAIARNDSAVYVAATKIAERRATVQSVREAALGTYAAGGASSEEAVRHLQQQYKSEAAEVLAAAQALEALAEELSRDEITASRRKVWLELGRELREIEEMMNDTAKSGETMFSALYGGHLDQALNQRQALDEATTAMRRKLDGVTDLGRRLTELGRGDISGYYREVRLSSIAAIMLVLVTAVAASTAIGRSIAIPLRQSIDLAARIGRGDLSGRLPIERQDELGDLARALNDMTANLREIAARTRASAETLDASAADIRAATQEQAAAVAEQLAAIEETSATLTEITHSGAHMAGRAQEVISSAQGTRATSDQGLGAVESTVAAMDAIREQVETVAENIVMLSQRTQTIADIIMSVSTIAERSHLLALNASIEAAAAGEHGRTFSVVAGEIKKLADQARDATLQVRTNLGDIQQGINSSVMLTEEATKRVASGRRQNDATDAAIRRMADSIQESVQAFQQIVAGINQHQIGLEQVMQALQNIRTASTQTAGTTRQLDTAAASMGEQSQTLVAIVRNYRA